MIIIGSDNGLSPGRRQPIIWTNVGILVIGILGINFGRILIEIDAFSFNTMHMNLSSAKWSLFCLGLNELLIVQHPAITLANDDLLSAEFYSGNSNIFIYNSFGCPLLELSFL